MKKVICIILLLLLFFIGTFIITMQWKGNKNEEIKIIGEEIEITDEENKYEGIVINNSKNGETISYFECTIIDIEEKKITVENFSHVVDYSIYEGDMSWHYDHQVIIDGKIYLTARYLLDLTNIPIKASNGKEISVDELKVGDTIKVSTKNIKYTTSLISTTLTNDNVIQIEKKNLF